MWFLRYFATFIRRVNYRYHQLWVQESETRASEWEQTLEAFALRDADDIDHLVLGEHVVNCDCLLEVLADPRELPSDWTAAVELDLHYVSLLLGEWEQLHLQDGCSTSW